MRDLSSLIEVTRGISPAAAVTDNTPFVSQIVTVDSQSVTFVGQLGALADADATFTLLVEEGDDSGLSDAAAVADKDLIGTEANGSFIFSDDNKCLKIGYMGSKKYARVTITPANNSGNVFIAGVWIKGHVRSLPKSTQLTS